MAANTTSDTSQSNNIASLKAEAQIGSGQSLTQLALRRLRRDRATMIAIAIILLLTLASIFAPFICNTILQVDPNSTDPTNSFLPFGAPGHVLGTDNLGRDQLARLLYAGQISLGIGFFGAVFTIVIGLSIGIMTGYYGGIFDDIINWVITTLDSIPQLFLLLIVMVVFKPLPATLIAVFALLGWTGTTRLIRGETLAIRSREYIVSASAVGASSWRIMFVHILPNVISILTVTLTLGIGGLILAESVLSFLGIGIQPPTPTWGNMLTRAQSFFVTGPHLVWPPGILIVVTVLCLYIIGDGIRDAFDPTTID
jgi:peptide/nickel transport system permease protein